jgi:hypothetical protein
MWGKPNIYIDCENTVFDVKTAVLKQAKKENKNFPDSLFQNTKTNSKDAFVKLITKEVYYKILSNNDFWENIKIDVGFVNFYRKYEDMFNWNFIINSHANEFKKLLECYSINVCNIVKIPTSVEREFGEQEPIVDNGVYVSSDIKELNISDAFLKFLIDESGTAALNPLTPDTECFIVKRWENIDFALDYFARNPYDELLKYENHFNFS